MLESFNVRNELQYHKLTPEEQQNRGILGRLVGVIADFKNPTRNGRLYTEELWDKQFNSPLMQERLQNRLLLGELGHPEDRQEIDMEKVAICLAEPPKKGNDGKIYGVFDILATPNGKILKTLCDYGCKIGVSSRGSGDTFEGVNGTETVDPDSYECECWDAVVLPSVKSARPKYVTESLDTSRKPLKEALEETIKSATEEEQKTMNETLDELKIDYSQEDAKEASEPVDNIDVAHDDKKAAEDDGANILNELQEALERQQKLETQIRSLQEKLSVCYTKEARFGDVLSSVKNELAESKKTVTTLTTKNQELNESLKEAKKTVTETASKLQLVESKLTEARLQSTSLNEGLNSRSKTITSLNEKLETMRKTHEAEKKQLEDKNKNLVESLNEAQADIKIIRGQTSAKLASSQQLVEKYKRIAKTAVDKYIASQAVKIGVSVDDIKNKLNENYSFKDIDTVCESLKSYKLAANALPFNLTQPTAPKMKIRESKEAINSGEFDYQVDDDIDDSFFSNI